MMDNQERNRVGDGHGPVGATLDFKNFWDNLGSGGRTIAGILIVFLVMIFFLNNAESTWVDVPFSEGESENKYQFVETLRNGQVEFRFTPQGQIQVSQKNIGKVLSMMQGVPRIGVREDPFSWVRQSDSLLGNTRQREQRWERSQIQKLEEDLARLDGIVSVSVTPSSAVANTPIGASRKINGVSVQIRLEEGIFQEGISQEVARAIGLHVSGAYAVSLDKIILTDTFGHHYDLVNPKLTDGDVVGKKKIVENYVTDYLDAIFPTDMFRVNVAVRLQTPAEDNGFIDNRFPVVRGIHDIQEQVASLTTTSSQFADTVVARATSQQIPVYSDSDPNLSEVNEVSVTVMLDREKAFSIVTSRFAGTENQSGFNTANRAGYRETPEAVQALRGFTSEVAEGIESYLKVHLGTATVVEARVFPVRFGGVATVSNGAVPFGSFSGAGNNNFSFLIFVLCGIVSIFVMLRDGPTDISRQASIEGFRTASTKSVAGIREAINTYMNEESQISYEQSLKTIRDLSIEESVTIIREVVSGTRETLPGCEVLALLILDQGGNRDLIFQQLRSDELAILGEVIQDVGFLTEESVEDAMAALELFQNGNAEFSAGITLPSFINSTNESSSVDQTVIEDIRATDPDLADLIERNRRGSESREVQSS